MLEPSVENDQNENVPGQSKNIQIYAALVRKSQIYNTMPNCAVFIVVCDKLSLVATIIQ